MSLSECDTFGVVISISSFMKNHVAVEELTDK